MIRISRGRDSTQLSFIHKDKLPAIRRLAEIETLSGKEIVGYGIARDALWRAQHYKCCYCEQKIRANYNDVEHYRPKGRAVRRPGSTELYGYWWLAFTWENLLVSCPSCNRSAKNDLFPLSPGDVPLKPEEHPPGEENPLIIDPGGILNPIEHIQFSYLQAGTNQPTSQSTTKQWFARPRNGSLIGNWSISIYGLNDPELIELRNDHVKNFVLPHANELQAALGQSADLRLRRAFSRALSLLDPRSVFVALTYDALRHFVPNRSLKRWDLRWPRPGEVAT